MKIKNNKKFDGCYFDIPQFKCFREQDIMIDNMSFDTDCLYYRFVKRYKNSMVTGEIMIPVDDNNYNENDIIKIMKESLENLYDNKK